MSYFGFCEPERKEDGSPVTLADRAAEKIILQHLPDLIPNIPAIGEESATGSEPVGSYKRFWLIDPLDGTRGFIENGKEFTVNIALVEDGLPAMGVVYAPAKDVMYCGDAAYGAFCSTAGGRLERLPVMDHPDKLVVVISKRHPTKGTEHTFLEKLRKRMPVEVLNMDSSLKICMVAEGSASVYFRAGRTMYWDTAAGHAVARAAGSVMRRWNSSEELSYCGPTLENPSFIVLHPRWEELLDTIL